MLKSETKRQRSSIVDIEKVQIINSGLKDKQPELHFISSKGSDVLKLDTPESGNNSLRLGGMDEYS